MMIPASSLFRIFCLTLVTCTPYLSSQLNLDSFHIQSSTAIKHELIFGEVFAEDPTHCALNCLANTSCLSASFDQVNQSCFLSVYHVNRSDDELISKSSWMTITREGCSSGWVRIGETCYFFNAEKSIQYAAENICSNYGGKLAEPQTNASFQLLKNYLVERNGRDRFWTGLIVVESGGNFTYVWNSTGIPPSYTDWADGEPLVQFTYDRCVGLQDDHKWRVARCRGNKKPLCEM